MTNKELVASNVDLNGLGATILPGTDRRYWFWLLAILGSYGIIQGILISVVPLSYDEGLSLQVAYLIDRGYEPYTQIFTLAYPYFVWLVGRLGQFNLSPNGFKLFFLGFSLLLTANTALIARYLFGNAVSLAAALMLAISPVFLAEAAAVLAVLPAMSLATLALLFTLKYFSSRQRRWLMLGGAVWGSALFFSPAALSTGIFALVLLFLLSDQFMMSGNQPLSWRRKAGAGSVWILSAITVVALSAILVTPPILFGHILKNEAIIRDQLPLSQANNFVSIGQFAAFNLGLFLLGGYSVVRIYGAFQHHLWYIAIWGLLNFCWLMAQVTLRPVEIAILLPPLAIMAGWAVIDIGQRIRATISSSPVSGATRRVLFWSIVVGLIGIYLLVVWQRFNSFIFQDIGTEGHLAQLKQRPEIVSFIQQHTNAHDCVIIDDAALAIAAGRLPAPALVELSPARLAAGLITETELVAALETYNCTAVIFSKREYNLHLRKFSDGVSAAYPNQQKFTRTRIYYQ